MTARRDRFSIDRAVPDTRRELTPALREVAECAPMAFVHVTARQGSYSGIELVRCRVLALAVRHAVIRHHQHRWEKALALLEGEDKPRWIDTERLDDVERVRAALDRLADPATAERIRAGRKHAAQHARRPRRRMTQLSLISKDR